MQFTAITFTTPLDVFGIDALHHTILHGGGKFYEICSKGGRMAVISDM
jgi:hypothetical protein